jgi:hypothetical protein
MHPRIVLLALVVGLAGCTGGGGSPPTPTPSTQPTPTPIFTTPTPPAPTPVDVEISGWPPLVESSAPFNVTVNLSGPDGALADVINVYSGFQEGAPKDVNDYPNPCAKTSGTVPGSYVVTCSFIPAGPTYLVGYVRVNGTLEYWSQNEGNLTIVHPPGPFTITSPDATADPTGQNPPSLPPAVAGQADTIHLQVAGDGNWSATNVSLAIDSCNGVPACSMAPPCKPLDGAAPGSFALTCTFAGGGTFVVEGQMTIAVGTSVHVFHGTKMQIAVVPTSPG